MSLLGSLVPRLRKLQLLGHALAQDCVAFSTSPLVLDLQAVLKGTSTAAASKEASVLFDFAYLSSPAAHEHRIRSSDALTAASEAASAKFAPLANPFLSLLRGILGLIQGVRQQMEALHPGDILGAEAALGRKAGPIEGNDLQTLIEAVSFLAFLLLLLDNLLPADTRERLLILAYRQHATPARPQGSMQTSATTGHERPAQGGAPTPPLPGAPPWTDLEPLCLLCRKETVQSGWFSGSSTPVQSTNPLPFAHVLGRVSPVIAPKAGHELVGRFPLAEGIVKELLGTLVRVDLYSNLQFYPKALLDPLQRTRALSLQTGHLALLLLWLPDKMRGDKALMSSACDKFLGCGGEGGAQGQSTSVALSPSWVVPVHLGFLLDLSVLWAPYAAAKGALLPKLTAKGVAAVAQSVGANVPALRVRVTQLSQMLSEAAEASRLTGLFSLSAQAEVQDAWVQGGAHAGAAEAHEHVKAPGDASEAGTSHSRSDLLAVEGSHLVCLEMRQVVEVAPRVVETLQQCNAVLQWFLTHLASPNRALLEPLLKAAEGSSLVARPPKAPSLLSDFIASGSPMWEGGSLVESLEAQEDKGQQELGKGGLLLLLMQVSQLEMRASRLYRFLWERKRLLLSSLRDLAAKELRELRGLIASPSNLGSSSASMNPETEATGPATLDGEGGKSAAGQSHHGLAAWVDAMLGQLNQLQLGAAASKQREGASMRASGLSPATSSSTGEGVQETQQEEEGEEEEGAILSALEEAQEFHHWQHNSRGLEVLTRATLAVRDMGVCRAVLTPSLLASLRRVGEGAYLWGSLMGVLDQTVGAVVRARPGGLVQLGQLWLKLAKAMKTPLFSGHTAQGQINAGRVVPKLRDPQVWFSQALDDELQRRVVHLAARQASAVLEHCLSTDLVDVTSAGPRDPTAPPAQQSGAPSRGMPGSAAREGLQLLQLEARVAETVSAIFMLDGMRLGVRIVNSADTYVLHVKTLLWRKAAAALGSFQEGGKGGGGIRRGAEALESWLTATWQHLHQLRVLVRRFSSALRIQGEVLLQDGVDDWVSTQFETEWEAALVATAKRKLTVPASQLGMLVESVLGLTSPDESLHLPPLSAWYSPQGKERLGMRLLGMLSDTLGLQGVRAVHALLRLKQAEQVAFSGRILEGILSFEGNKSAVTKAWGVLKKQAAEHGDARVREVKIAGREVFGVQVIETKEGKAWSGHGRKVRVPNGLVASLAIIGQIEILKRMVRDEMEAASGGDSSGVGNGEREDDKPPEELRAFPDLRVVPVPKNPEQGSADALMVPAFFLLVAAQVEGYKLDSLLSVLTPKSKGFLDAGPLAAGIITFLRLSGHGTSTAALDKALRRWLLLCEASQGSDVSTVKGSTSAAEPTESLQAWLMLLHNWGLNLSMV